MGMTTIYDFSAERSDGTGEHLTAYKGKLLLIVNTASQCGFTPQYKGLEQLYQKYKDRGFSILGFPCNQFQGQEPGENQEIEQFCKLIYGVTFPLFAKIEVNGNNTHPLYRYLKQQKRGLLLGRINWNFTKFLVNRDGLVIQRFAPFTKPEKLEQVVIKHL